MKQLCLPLAACSGRPMYGDRFVFGQCHTLILKHFNFIISNFNTPLQLLAAWWVFESSELYDCVFCVSYMTRVGRMHWICLYKKTSSHLQCVRLLHTLFPVLIFVFPSCVQICPSSAWLVETGPPIAVQVGLWHLVTLILQAAGQLSDPQQPPQQRHRVPSHTWDIGLSKSARRPAAPPTTSWYSLPHLSSGDSPPLFCLGVPTWIYDHPGIRQCREGKLLDTLFF